MQRTLVLLKPDAIQRGLIGNIVSRLERRGMRFVAMKLMKVTEELARRHYGDHVGKPFFEGLVRFITSSPIVAMVVEGENAVELIRTTMGATNPRDAAPGTIRGDLAVSIGPQPGSRLRLGGVGGEGDRPLLLRGGDRRLHPEHRRLDH